MTVYFGSKWRPVLVAAVVNSKENVDTYAAEIQDGWRGMAGCGPAGRNKEDKRFP